MPSYRAPVKDTQFVLSAVVGLDKYSNLPGFADATSEMVGQVLEGGAKFCENVLAPINLSGDQEGCTRHADGSVTAPAGFKAAYDAFVEAGWGTLTADPAYGGQGLPHVVGTAIAEYLSSANMAFSMYPGLNEGAQAAIQAVGSDAQKRTYLPKMVEGRWTGTMNLTEPQCGTDLGLIRTRAEPQAPDSDGRVTHQITGTKIFISAGEHDLSDNIIHLVLAKTTGAPDNVKGISLFIVPKFIVNDDGSLGARNGVTCGSIEHKMGIHANATCVMNYDGATGYLIGEENKGLRAMFIMMNVARLGVGVQGLAQGEVAYQNAAIYARDRVQGKALAGAATPAKADPIIVHADVRRMLMDGRAFNEGARALILWGALQVDLSHKAATAEERQTADDLIGLLTPVIKGYCTDKGYDIATASQQVYGGHGYIAEWGMEQFVRDARIAQIYEGTNGIQAMDLVGRKLGMNGGRALRAYLQLLAETIVGAKGDARLVALTAGLEKAVGELQAATMWLMANGLSNPDNAGAAAVAYLHLMGIVALGHMWLVMATAAYAAIDTGAGDREFLEHKLITARYFAERFFPDAGALRRKLEAGAEAMMALPAAAF